MTPAQLTIITDALIDRGLVTGAAQVREMWNVLFSVARMAERGKLGRQHQPVTVPSVLIGWKTPPCNPFCGCAICYARMLTYDPERAGRATE